MNDISIFIAAGKRFTVDVKLHGVGCLIDSVQYESTKLDTVELSEKIIPLVVALVRRSCNPRIARLADALAYVSSMTEYSSEALGLLLAFSLDVNVIQ